MENSKRQQKKRVSKTATIAFVFMAALFLYTVFRVSGYLVRQELAGIPTPKNPEQNRVEEPLETPKAQPDDPSDAVIAVRTPPPESPVSASSATTAAPTPSARHTPQATPAPESTVTASPKPLTVRFDESKLDLLIVGFEESGYADLICVLSVRGEKSMFYALPKNTIGAGNTTLSTARSVGEVREQLAALTGVSFDYYTSFQETAVQPCTDAVDGIEIDGVGYSGEKALERLRSAGMDEVLRVSQQQSVLLAFAKKVQSLNLLRLWNAKNALQGNANSNLTGDQGWLLYRRLKGLDLESTQLILLPVDSEWIGSRRFYRLDQKKLEKFITEVYKNR